MLNTKFRAVFIDRDGVINKSIVRNGKPYPPASIEDFELLPGVETGIRSLHSAGFKIIVVTNQPDVTKGIQKQETVEAMHRKLLTLVPIDDIKVCYHIDEDKCECRKPKPGMIIEAATKWSIDLSRSFMIGDRWRDIDAGRAAGCKTFHVESDYEEQKPENPDWKVHSLLEASQIILKFS